MLTKNTKVFGLVLVCFWVCFWPRPVYDGRLVHMMPYILTTYAVECQKLWYIFDINRLMSKIMVYFQHIPSNVKNSSLFSNRGFKLRLFLVRIFGKIFGKFCKTFGCSKPLFSFGPVSTVDNFWLSNFNFRKNFWQTHGLILHCCSKWQGLKEK